MITNWAKCLYCFPYLTSAIFSQWLNSNIKNDNKSIFISGFASKNINFVGQFFHENGKTNNNGIILSQNTILKAEISFDSINRCFT